MMEKEDRKILRVSIAMNNVEHPVRELINALSCLDKKDDQIKALNAKIDRIRKTAFEMISNQTHRITELEKKK